MSDRLTNRSAADKNVKEIQQAFPGIFDQEPLQPTLCLVEEAGEFAGAIRRWKGLARRSGTKEEVMLELADVVITAYVAARVYGFNLDEAIERKWKINFSRGYKEQLS